MIGERELTLDTSVIIKGVIPPKRRDEKHNERIRKFETANTYMKLLFSGKIIGFIPSAVLVELSAVGARLTGSEKFGISLAGKLEEICTVLYDEEILDTAIEVSAQYKASGFDNLLLACAVLTNTPLFTDDKKLHSLCDKAKIKSYLLDDLVK
ncbi:MAG: PIN domain-containing protein [Theionarchaea archaeon]|nr:PIN domain-containing protein [Theionarchaea archaeon]